MNSRFVPLLCVVTLSAVRGFSQEITLEEIRVEAPFDVRLSPPNDLALRTLLERLNAHAEMQREVELRKANQGTVTNVLDLLQAPLGIPFGLSSRDRLTDEFFLQNYMRADLNPRESNSLFPGK